MTTRQAQSEYARVAGPAVSKVGKAVRSGAIVKAMECADCGSCAPVEGHHHNGYAADHALDVVWLCRTCHMGRHRKPKPLWERAPREYQRLTGRVGYADVQTFTYTTHSTPKFLLKTVRRLWALLRTDDERAAVLALVNDLAASDVTKAAA